LFTKGTSAEQQLDDILSGINSVFTQIELAKRYEKKIVISISFGNEVSGELRSRTSIKVEKSIYISPISDSLQYLRKFPGFVISSTNDEYLTSDDMIELGKLGNDEVLIFKDASHSLESDSVIDTIDFIKNAVIKIEEILLK